MTQPAIEYVQGALVCHEPNKPASCESTARAINDFILKHEYKCSLSGRDGSAFMARVPVIDDDNVAFPVGVKGSLDGIYWRATLTKTESNNMVLDDANRIVWWLFYEVEPCRESTD